MEERETDLKLQYKETLSCKSEGGFMRIKKILQNDPHKHKTIVLIPGWCESFKMMENIALGLVKDGYNIFVLDYQYLDNLAAAEEALKTMPEAMPKNEYIKALALTNFFKKRNLEDISIVAHSEGSIIAVLAAQLSPGLFKNLLLVSPAGLIREKSFFRLTMKFIYSIYKQETRNFGGHFRLQIRYTIELFKVMFSNPLQSFKDGFAMSNHNIIKYLSKIERTETKINYIFYDEDVLFPLEEFMLVAHREELSNIEILAGGHNELFIHSEDFITTVKRFF